MERNHGGIFLTKGWRALHDFYNVSLGAWVTVVFVGNGKFKIRIKDRFGKTIRYPTVIPPMKFLIDKDEVYANFIHCIPSPFTHDILNFQYTYEKKLDSDEIKNGVMVGCLHWFYVCFVGVFSYIPY